MASGARAQLRNVLLLVRDVSRSAEFYEKGLGLPLIRSSERWAELSMGSAVLALKQAKGEAPATSGYSPFLNFNVRELESVVAQLVQRGAVLDGPVKYPVIGKVAALRSPDGQMIGLLESDGAAGESEGEFGGGSGSGSGDG